MPQDRGAGHPSLPIRRVPQEDAAPLARFTYPARRHLLESPGERRLVIAAASSDGDDVGLAFAWIAEENVAPGEAELISIHLDPPHRSDAALLDLLHAVEAGCRGEGVRVLTHAGVIWNDDTQLHQVLTGDGWSKPAIKQLMCRTTVEQALATPWLVQARLPEGFSIVDWMEMGEARRTELERRAAEGQAFWPELLDPFRHEVDLFKPTSVALLHEDRVRGWILCHTPTADEVRWTVSWVDDGLQGMGRIIPLWLAAVERQAARTEIRSFMWSVPVTLPRMCRFVTRRMRPWLTRLGHATTRFKRLER